MGCIKSPHSTREVFWEIDFNVACNSSRSFSPLDGGLYITPRMTFGEYRSTQIISQYCCCWSLGAKNKSLLQNGDRDPKPNIYSNDENWWCVTRPDFKTIPESTQLQAVFITYLTTTNSKPLPKKAEISYGNINFGIEWNLWLVDTSDSLLVTQNTQPSRQKLNSDHVLNVQARHI